ncbi:hypothetical protein M8C21_027180, partial [Ambrosia artemisiifolia]
CDPLLTTNTRVERQTHSASMDNKDTANGSPPTNKTPKSSAKKSRGPPQSSVDTYAVQCNDCFKWRTLATEDQFEE